MSLVQVEKEGKLVVLTINNPPVNALNSSLLGELENTVDELAATDIAVLIITGAGEKAFVAGADISEFPQLNRANGEKLARRGQLIFQKIADFPVPVIAAVNGIALGGGLELALACDIRVMALGARFGLPEVTLAIFPGYGGTQRLPRLISPGKARELIFTGDLVDAEDAVRLGLAEYVTDDVLSKAKMIAQTIMKRGPVAIRQAKKAINRGLEVSLGEGMKIEAALFGELCDTEDQKEGARAFLEKRKPIYKGK
ncbi:MAG: enoyl-CoA hydratase [Firmicutes bacterium]|jgi:enoyl-CoA hydratase|nr:enoyl-CoA hydratase [Bacillota bacterium]